MLNFAHSAYLLDRCHIVGTPGSGFGPSVEGYFSGRQHLMHWRIRVDDVSNVCAENDKQSKINISSNYIITTRTLCQV